MLTTLKRQIFSNELLANSTLLFFASLFGSGFLFIASILLAKIFGPTEFANFKIATNLFIFIPSLIEFGIGVTLTKYIAEYKTDQPAKIPHLILSLLKIRVISFAFLMLCLFFFRETIAELFFHDPHQSILVLAGLWITGFIYFEAFKQILLGFEDFKTYATSQFLTLFLSALFSLVLGYYYGVFWAILGWGLSYLIGNIPGLFATLAKTRKTPSHSFDTRPILYSYSLPMYSLILPNLLGTALVPLLSLFFSKTLIGLFAFGMIFYNGSILIPQAFNQVLLPNLSKTKTSIEQTHKLRQTLLQYTLLIIPAIFATILFMPFFIQLVSPDYTSGTLLVTSLVILSLVLGYFSILSTYYTALGNAKTNWIVTIVKNSILFIAAFLLLTNFSL